MENMMNKISKKAVETYNAASKATGKVTKEIKLKSKMSENNSKVNELYEDIGKTVYEKYVLKENVSFEGDLLNNCVAIDALAEENENIRMELLKLKDLKQCPKCHYEIYHDFHFCPNCGYVQEDENKTEKAAENDGPATIVTTDGEDETLKQHVDSFPTENETNLEEDIEMQKDNQKEVKLDNDDE